MMSDVIIKTDCMTWTMKQLTDFCERMMQMMKEQGDDSAIWRSWAEADKEIKARNHADRGYTKYHNAVARLEQIDEKIARIKNDDEYTGGDSSDLPYLKIARIEMNHAKLAAQEKWEVKNGCICELLDFEYHDCSPQRVKI